MPLKLVIIARRVDLDLILFPGLVPFRLAVPLRQIPKERPREISHLFRTLIDQQRHHMHIRMIPKHRLRDVLEQCRLPRLRRRHDQPALPITNRTKQINQTTRGRTPRKLKRHAGLRINTGQIPKCLAIRERLRAHPLDLDEPLNNRTRLAGLTRAFALPTPPTRLAMHHLDLDAQPIPQRE